MRVIDKYAIRLTIENTPVMYWAGFSWSFSIDSAALYDYSTAHQMKGDHVQYQGKPVRIADGTGDLVKVQIAVAL